MNDNIYTLRDLQGGTFGEKRILKGEKEVFETFQEWAENDEMEDPTLKNWSFGELIAVWGIEILKLDWETLAFKELTDEELLIKNQ
jgi:hypothetical protein